MKSRSSATPSNAGSTRKTRQTFRPSPGKIMQYHPPGGLGVRIDSAVYQGYVIPPYYNSLVGKLIVHGKTRGECLMRLRRALDEMVVEGIETTLPLFRALVREPGDHRRRLPYPLARTVSGRPAGRLSRLRSPQKNPAILEPIAGRGVLVRLGTFPVRGTA